MIVMKFGLSSKFIFGGTIPKLSGVYVGEFAAIVAAASCPGVVIADFFLRVKRYAAIPPAITTAAPAIAFFEFSFSCIVFTYPKSPVIIFDPAPAMFDHIEADAAFEAAAPPSAEEETEGSPSRAARAEI